MKLHIFVSLQLLLKASFATSANVRSRPRRPMKPLEELLNPPESQTQPVQSQRGDAQPNTTAESITSATAPETASSGPLPPAVERSPAQRFSQRRFGVVSPQELPSSNSWVGSKNGPDRGNGRNGQGSVNQRESENGGRARTARMEDLREDRDSAAERKRMGFAASTQRRSDPGPSRVSFAQILKSSKAPPQKPTNETPDRAGRPQEKKKEVPIPTEDPEDIMSIPIREAAPRALPSWKVGLANREKRAAKAAVKDGEQRVNEAITAKNVRLVDPEGDSLLMLAREVDSSNWSVIIPATSFI